MGFITLKLNAINIHMSGTFFFFFWLRNKHTHTKGRGKEILTQRYITTPLKSYDKF